jgi:DNA-binding transcriptional ArsR family regulator
VRFLGKGVVLVLDSLITSKTRIKLLCKFFLNPEARSYLRELSDEFGESTNAVRVELNRLEKAGLLASETEGRTKVFSANTQHTLFPEIHNLVRKTLGIDQLVERVLSRIGNLHMAFITGDYARGVDSGILDLVLVGDIDWNYLQRLVNTAEEILKRKIRVLVLRPEEVNHMGETLHLDKALVVWTANGQAGA